MCSVSSVLVTAFHTMVCVGGPIGPRVNGYGGGMMLLSLPFLFFSLFFVAASASDQPRLALFLLLSCPVSSGRAKIEAGLWIFNHNLINSLSCLLSSASLGLAEAR